MPVTTHAGVAIAWEETGDPAHPPLLLIMGHVFGSAMWHRSLEGLSERFRVIRYDNWGIGESGCPDKPHTIDRMARDAEAVLAAAGVPRAHVFGMGMGGLVAQELAITAPTRVGALVLGSTGCPGAETGSDSAPSPLHRLPVSKFFKLDRQVLYSPASPDEAVQADLAIMRATPISTPALKAQARAVERYRSFDRVSGITAPTLVVHGDRDQLVPLTRGRELAEQIPDAELMVIPATGHNLTTPYGGPLTDAITFFLTAHSSTHGIPRQSG